MQLERNFRQTERQRYNGMLYQLAMIGQELARRTNPRPTIYNRLVKVAQFMAKVFPEDLTAIWYIQGISPPDIYACRKEDLDQLSERLKVSEWDLADEFQEWLNGTREYLEGVN